jgi:flagellar basal body-associated protein FliL
MDDFVEFFLPIIVLICLLIGGIVGVSWWIGQYECSTYKNVTGKETKYAAMTCYINKDGEWMSWSEYKLRYATRGAKD